MNKIKMFVINLLFKAQIGKWVGKLFAKMDGYKTQVGIVLVIGLKLAIAGGFIPAEYVPIVEEILNGIYGAITISFGDKVKKYWKAVKDVGDDVIGE